MASIAEDQEKYEKNINSLIVHAEREAETKVVQLGKADKMKIKPDGGSYRHDYFAEFFTEAMNRMAKEMGYRDL